MQEIVEAQTMQVSGLAYDFITVVNKDGELETYVYDEFDIIEDVNEELQLAINEQEQGVKYNFREQQDRDETDRY